MSSELSNAGLVLGTGLLCSVGIRCARAWNDWLARRKNDRQEWSKSLAGFDAALVERRPAEPATLPHEPAWKGYRRLIVDRVRDEADGIKSFHLVPEDGRALADFQAGQYLSLRVPIPGFAQPQMRCYSLSDRPHRSHYRVSIKLAGRVSGYLHEQAKPGCVLESLAPRGDFVLDLADRRPIVLVAGGIGITPVFSMLATALAVDPAREITLFYGVRNRREHAFRSELLGLAKQHSGFQYVPCYSRPDVSDRAGSDYVAARRVDIELMRTLLGEPRFPVYLCGPSAMMNALVADLRAWGCNESDVRYEAFGPATVAKTTTESGEPARTFRVKFSRSAKTPVWTSRDGTLLDLADANGIPLVSGCRSGNCGACAVRLQEGNVSYSTKPAADIPAGHCLACVAQPASDLVVDG